MHVHIHILMDFMEILSAISLALFLWKLKCTMVTLASHSVQAHLMQLCPWTSERSSHSSHIHHHIML